MGALYSVVSGLLAVISRAYPRFLSPVPQNIKYTQCWYCTVCMYNTLFCYACVYAFGTFLAALEPLPIS